MTNQELNTALYEKMFAEQEKYRGWLLSQPPEEILNHAYSYYIREDFLLSQEMSDLTSPQCHALLKQPSVMDILYEKFDKLETDHMNDIKACVEDWANDIVCKQKRRNGHER